MPLSDRNEREAAALLRRLLAAIEKGKITVDGPAAVAVVRRLEGALLALEAQSARRQA